MIELSLTSAVVLYSAMLGFFVLAIWAYTEFRVRRSYHVLEKQYLWRCVFCGYMYVDEEARHVSRCPRCESYNSVEDHHARFVPVDEPEDDALLDTAQRNTSHRKRPHQRRRGPRKRR